MCDDIITESLGGGGGAQEGQGVGRKGCSKGGNIFPLLSPRQTLQDEHVSFFPLRKEETEVQSGHTTGQALTVRPLKNVILALLGFYSQTQCSCLGSSLPTHLVITQSVFAGCLLHTEERGEPRTVREGMLSPILAT